VRDRLIYTLRSLPPWIILGHTLLNWGVVVAYPFPGWEVSGAMMATSYLLIFLLVLTLDACECPRRFHLWTFTYTFLALVWTAVMNALFWPDVVVNNGTQTDAGWVGRFTGNGLRKTSYYGVMSLMAPAMVTAWLDTNHHSCYLVTDFLFKVDMLSGVTDYSVITFG
jgi:hypothetical protein